MRQFFALLGVAMFFLSACEQDTQRKLPVLGRKKVVPEQVNGRPENDTLYHTIADFQFVNQDSVVVTNETFEDKIYVADFFFTSCPTICPIMKTQMLRVYEKFKENEQVMILSHSIDPQHDTVAVLRDYAQRLGVSSGKWHFITGDIDKIYDIGQTSYMTTAMEDENEPGGFLHSGAFILVDKQRRVRGIYDGTEAKQVSRLLKDIPVLLAEYERQAEQE
jgi:protein SCO1